MNNMFSEAKASWDEHVANINTKYEEGAYMNEQELELEFEEYTDHKGRTSTLTVVIEFETDGEFGETAHFYTAVKDKDNAFFSLSIFKFRECPDGDEDAWVKFCGDKAREWVESGEIDFKDVKNWLER